METGDKATPVSQREFHSALVLVWTFIMLAFSTAVFRGSPSPFSATANVIYLVASLFMVINSAIASFRSDPSRKRVGALVLFALAALVLGAVSFFAGRISN